MNWTDASKAASIGSTLLGCGGLREFLKTDGAKVGALTDSGQLLSAQHVDDAIAADSALQDYGAAGTFFYFSYAD